MSNNKQVDLKEVATNLFLSKIKSLKEYTKDDIWFIQHIDHGYTNDSFKLTTRDGKSYQVRIGGSNDVVDRNNEAQIIKVINNGLYVYLDKSGNAIKKWIEGEPPVFEGLGKKNLLKILANEIMKLHSIDISNTTIIKHDYFFNWDKTPIDEKYAKTYKELYEKFKDLPLVLSHNDLNPMNMIYSKKEKRIYLIDYEWGRLNNAYWDYANFFREANLDLKFLDYMVSFDKTLNPRIARKFLFMCTVYALQWTYTMKDTPPILKYRKMMHEHLEKYWPLANSPY